MLGTTVFAGNGDKIEITLSLPSIGDTISTDELTLTTSLEDASCTVWKIYSGVSVNDVAALTTSESFVSFCDNDANKEKEASDGTYTQEEYVAIIAVESNNITDATEVTFNGATGGKLFFRNSLYVYVSFAPTGNTSASDTPTGDSSYTPSNNSHDVYVTYQAGASSPTIYSVDIVWESMEFTYTAASEGTWDPETHAYTNKQNASWSFANNKITVTNHSNTEVKATFSYTPATNYSAVNGAFVDVDKNPIHNATLTLNSAVDSTLDEAPSGTAYLSLTGELSSNLETKTVCGTVTVTIN